MTRHARYLQQRPARVALKRLKRRRLIKNRKQETRMSVRHMRDVLRDYVASHPTKAPVRVGKKSFGDRIKGMFRKPTV